jgi:hypothetical protein
MWALLSVVEAMIGFLAGIVFFLAVIVDGPLNFLYAIEAYLDGNIASILGCNLVDKPRPMSKGRDSPLPPYLTVSDTLSNLLYLSANVLGCG